MKMRKRNYMIAFKIAIPVPKGAICTGCFRQSSNIARVSIQSYMELNIQKAHALLGSNDEETIQATAKAFGSTITWGALKPCKTYTCAKVKQKNVNIESTSMKSSMPNGHVCLDLVRIKVPKHNGIIITNINWHGTSLCARTSLWKLHACSSSNRDRTGNWFASLGWKILVKTRNSKKMQKFQLEPWNWYWTSCKGHMQQNHLAEHGFAYLATTGCSMMSNANFSIDYTKNAFELWLFLMEINY